MTGAARDDIEDIYPLSPMQQGMLFHTLYEPGSRIYFEQARFELDGDLDAGAFERAWRDVAARHPILRTAFLWEGLPEPLQVVHRRVDVPFETLDWSGLDEAEQRTRLAARLEEDHARPLDLTSAPLLRLTLVRLAPRRHHLVWTFHHVLLDGWSLSLVLKEVLTLHDAHRLGRPAQLPPARSFSEYVAWLQKRDASAAEAYWRSALAGFEEPTPLRVERPGATGGGGSAEVELRLTEEATADLQAFARARRVTLNTVVQGAWALLLHHYSGRDDVVFGATASGRPADLPGVEGIVGLFINTLPHRVRIEPEAPVARWLQAIQERQAEMRQHEHAPLVDVQRWSGVAPGRGLFDSILVFENYPLDGLAEGKERGLALRGTRATERTNYPLTVGVDPGRRLVVKLLYDAARFEEDVMTRMLAHLETLLLGLAADPQRPVGDVPVLTEEERARLDAWSGGASAFPGDGTVHGGFEAQAARSPDAVALAAVAGRVSYARLNADANRLARHLRALGVAPGALVGLCVEGTADFVLGALAILKAGGAYVPLDPAYPAERLRLMLEDTRAPLVLTREALLGALPGDAPRAVCLDRDAAAWADASPADVDGGATATDLAYVIYTSGSTGKPKGVAVPHRAVLRLVHDTDYVRLTPEDRVAQASTTSFDAATFEVWSTLLHGARLVEVPRGVLLAPQALADHLQAEGVGTMFLTTALFQRLAVESPRVFEGMRNVLFGGEACDPRRVRDVLRAGGPERLLHVYGPTESTTFATWHLVRDVPPDATTVPIGRPIANTTLRVLDPRGRPAPLGVPGELFIGGDGLAREYLHRPDVTAERFVPDPLAPGERLYRTGDLVRWRADGTLEFLGRLDHQVKVRGFRIELGEVEAAFLANPDVRDAVAVVREDGGEKRLVAYVVPAREGVAGEDVRAALKRTLPDAMVPSWVIVLDALPLNPNGKVEKRALPAPDLDRLRAGAAHVPPATPTEEILAGVWADVLKVDRVGVEDDFFTLGGHSLLATQVVSRARAALGVDLPLRAVFGAPTVRGLAGVADALRGASRGEDASRIPRAPRDAPLPLSFAQERLWFLHQWDPESPVYNVPACLRFSGRLDVLALERALDGIVRRHEALRTTFADAGDGPVQRVAPHAPFRLDVMDVSEDAVAPLADEEARRPFDLTRGPVFRARLLRLAPEEHVLLLTLHHVAFDGWSNGVLLSELSTLYRAFAQGATAPPLPDLPLQYADYAAWQRARLQGDALAREVRHWRDRLAGASPLDLPSDRPRPAAVTFRGDHHAFTLPKPLLDRARALARQEGATLYMTLLAAFKTLLHRYSGQDDVTVGSPIAGRTRAEVEGLIGFFVNTLVLRTDLSGEPTFRDLLARVRETCLDAYAHQDVPFEKLVEELHPQRDTSRNPLVQVVFVLEQARGGGVALDGLAVSSRAPSTRASKFDLTLLLTETDAGLSGTIEYSTDLFDAATIARLARHYEVLLAGLAESPDKPVTLAPLLAPEERRALLPPPAASPVPTRTLHAWFEAQAARTPDAVAVTFQDRALTYRELDARANRLAHRLQRLGVGPDVLVGLCLERSPDMIVGMLGILKAGGAYLPLDPAYPPERLAFMLHDAKAPVLVTQDELRDAVPLDGAATKVVLLDEDLSALRDEPDSPPASRATPQSLAYVIYTSGSTGKPKGVMVEHRHVARLFTATDAWFGFGPSDVWTMFHSFAFDFSVWEMWGALLHGGRLVVVPSLVAKDAAAFLALLKSEGVTVLNQTPSAFRVLMRADEAAPADLALRLVVFGGEALEPASLRPWVERHGDERPRLVNMYGITETTVHVTYRPLTRADVEAGHGSPIGRPIPDLQLYVLDRHRQVVPVGVPGELYVGGAGLARGYLHRPDLTQDRFVPDTLSRRLGARLYRTGDLAKLLPDGSVDYLGRMDHQVKVRGFRIELGEIESALVRHPGVREAVVLAREDAPGEKRLVAYLVPPPGAAVPPVGELRDLLRRSLPDHMVPAAFVPLDALPLTTNGKVDRRALPAPEPDRPDVGALVPPRTPMEEIVAGALAEVLRVERVGVHDDFFALGGHSLAAAQVVSRVRHAVGLELPLRVLFATPTVAALAAELERLAAADAAAPLPPVAPRAHDDPAPLSFAQERLWFVHQWDPESPAYNVPLALRLRGALRVDALARAFEEVARRHDVLRTTFARRDGAPVQVIHPPAPLPLPVTDISALPEAEREAEARRLADEEARRPFDLARGPVLRARVLRLAPEDHVLLVTVHHVAFDEASRGILLRELDALASAAGPLPPLPVSYADHAAWQRTHLSGEAMTRGVEHWRRRLEGLAPLALPTDRPRPAVQTHRGREHAFRVPAPLATGLRALARREGATLFMTLLAAFQALLQRHAGQDDVAVGSPIAGRTRQETEGLVGLFLNTLVLRTDLSGEPSFREALARVKEACLDAYAHQDVPFEKLVEELQPERDPSRTPLFQVAFTLQTGLADAVTIQGLDARPFPVGEPTAKFDLALSLAEAPDGLAGAFVANADLFDADTLDRMAARFSRLLARVVEDPDRPVARHDLLLPEERHAVLSAWRGPVADVPRRLVHALVEAQAARAPDRLAVAQGDVRLTYGDLDARATRLAGRLRRLGATRDAPVGVCLERSPDLLVALLGVLKAGAAYVPLDPAHPPERLRLMLHDARAPLVVTTRRLLEALGGDVAARPVLLDDAHDLHPAPDAPAPDAAPSDLAYVIYTSGSTGTPKGVMVEHASLANLVHWHNAAYEVTPDDRATLVAGLGFDASVWEAWPYLAAGASLHLPPDEETRADPERLVAWLAENDITISFLPTPLAERVLALDALPPMKLRALLTGGDRLRRAPPRPLPFDLVNHYGPTESTVVATACVVPPAVDDARPPPIGRPIANVRALVLDARGEPAPVGVPGELHLGGVGLARGYLHRPDLTAERFVEDPFEPGARLYRTGDLVRWRADGHLEFLGRGDDQVKVRGVRIEMGEVEAALARHAAVRECVVSARAGPEGARLVAYVVPAAGASPTRRDLREFLQRALPVAMVPSAFVLLDALPLTPNGKVDRRALPAPREEDADAAGDADALRSPVEEILAGVLADVLGVARVGPESDFFALGGHSLLATQVASRARDALGVDVPLRTIFASPTPRALAAAIADLQRAGAAPQPPLRASPRDEPAPLSFAQERLWFLHEWEPGSAAYHVPSAERIAGPLDVHALERALDEVLRRHDVLRARFVAEDGRPSQRAPPHAPTRLHVTDLSALPPEARAVEAQRVAEEEARRPFRLEDEPPARFRLLRLAPEDHVLLLTFHHIAFDAWSMGVLRRELGVLRDAFARGEDSPLPEPRLQYADYARWQRAWLQGDVLEAQLAYWRARLAGLSPLELPTDRPRPAVRSSRGAHHAFRLPASLARGLASLARREGATLHMTLLAAFQALLHRYSGQDDVAVGAPVAGRTRREVEDLVGFFVNTLVLRTDLSGDPSFREALRRVKEACLGAYAHQDVPFERLVAELQPQRDPSRTPLFQVMFDLETVPAADAEASRVPPGGVTVAGTTAKFDLLLNMLHAPDGIGGHLEYSTDLFDEDTILRMIGHYQALLERVAEDPDAPLARIPIVTPTERDRVLHEWNAPTAPVPMDACFHHLFERHAARAPDAVAASYGDARVTYGELNARANRLAHHLVALGVGADAPVGVCVERSLDVLVAVLGVLKAGGAYVPLDPAYPPDRLQHMLDDSRPPVLLTQRRLLDALPRHDARVVLLDDEAAIPPRSDDPDVKASPDQLAYVIYTSGSTGKPKGVMVPHRGLVNAALAWEEAYGLDASCVHLQMASFSFDVFAGDVARALGTGGRLVLCPRERLLDPESLHGILAGEGVTHAEFVPAVLRALAAHLKATGRRLSSMRVLVAGSDAWYVHEYEELRRLCGPGTRVVNSFGVTEATVDTTYYDGDASRLPGDGMVPIGRPFRNMTVRVLDRAGQLAPIGVPGELFIGGAGVARGYLHRPDLTAERFVPDPYAPGARLYRTGDLARWRADGTLEFLGRADQQVKVRGFRVELGEIEAALLEHTDVAACAVAARGDAPGDKRLVAYVVARPGAAGPGAAVLREHLKRKLPDPVVPSAFVVLDALPLTPNGKVDRRALPAPDPAAVTAGEAFVAPRDDAEDAVAAIWRDVLGVERVGARDDFFALGGHSLLAMQVVARIRDALGVELPLSAVFTHPTLEALARALVEAITQEVAQLSDEEAERALRAQENGR